MFDEHAWDVDSTVHFIVSQGFTRVALQLPDDLLRYSPCLADALARRLGPSYTVSVTPC